MPDGYADLHHHLLYGLDDGAESLDVTAQMLQRAAEEGVTHIAATPHIYPDRGLPDAAAYRERFFAAREQIRALGLPLTLHTGAEIYYTSMVPNLLRQGRLPTLGDSWYVLVEFHPHESYDIIRHAAMSIGNAGYSMVLAHAERCRSLRWGSRIAALREEAHVKIQMNCSTLLGRTNLMNRQWIHRVMREELVDVVASDAHGVSYRPCRLGECAQLIERTWGAKTAWRVCQENPLAILCQKQRLGFDPAAPCDG